MLDQLRAKTDGPGNATEAVDNLEKKLEEQRHTTAKQDNSNLPDALHNIHGITELLRKKHRDNNSNLPDALHNIDWSDDDNKIDPSAKATTDVDMLDAIPKEANKGFIGQSVMRIVKAAALKARAPPSDTSTQPEVKKAKMDKTDNKYKLTL